MSDTTLPPPDDAGIIKALTPTDPESTKLTASQQKRMTAIEQTVETLHAAEVAFQLFASPDVPSTQMRFVTSTKLGYDTRLAGFAQQVGLCRSQMLSIALKSFSVGLRGDLVLRDPEGKVLFRFANGVMEVGEAGLEVTA